MVRSLVILTVGILGMLMLEAMVFCGTAEARNGFGLGVIIGEPTGLSFKNWLSRTTAVDGAAAWSLRRDVLYFHLDYLAHNFGLTRSRDVAIYYGIGGRVSLRDEFEEEARVGVRIPVGIEVYALMPLGFFFEVVPLVNIAPSTDFELNGGFGIRFYFP